MGTSIIGYYVWFSSNHNRWLVFGNIHTGIKINNSSFVQHSSAVEESSSEEDSFIGRLKSLDDKTMVFHIIVINGVLQFRR